MSGTDQRPGRYLPVSFAQQRLWFLDQLVPGSSFYNEHTSVRLRFPVNAEALERSLNEIVRRHESLRTTFLEVDGQPVQVVAPTGAIPVSTIDVRHLPAGEREEAAIRLGCDEAAKPFDLRRGPLVRTTLLRLADFDYLFLVTMHHVVSDGWSLSVFGRELQTLYSAFELGHPSPLKPLTIQYGDFAVWQRRRLQGAVLEEHLSYWRAQLAEAPTLQLPTDLPRPPMPTFSGGVCTVEYPGRLLAELRTLSKREGVTLFMTLLAGFQLLLARYTSQEDIVVGVPIANRNRIELEGLIGFFVNTLAMRTRMDGNPSVRELLARVRAMALDAYAHQDLPFEKLVEELQPHRDLARNPIFQVVFQLLNTPAAAPNGPLDRTAQVERSTAKFDLTVHVGELADGLFARFEYSTDLFERSTIERFAGHYGRLLDAMAAHPDEPSFDLSFVGHEERERLLVEWNGPATAYPNSAGLQQLFEAQAARTPDANAVRFDGVTLTYRELNRRANRLARDLRRAGAGPDVLVAVAVERSAEMIVAVLAVVKAGAAYVPIDPGYPDLRIALMLADTRAPVVVTQAHLRSRLPATGVHVLAVPGVADDEDDDNVPGSATLEHLAYVMYTSGSTGIPKGVAVPQRGVVRLVLETNYVSLGPSDRIAQVASFSFDAATFEIWGALLNGAALVGIRHDVALAPAEFARELRQEGITAMFLTSALFNHVASLVPDAFATMRTLIVGGDVVDAKWAAHVLQHGAPARLVNGYGPTESTTFAVCGDITEQTMEGGTVPIGRPIANTRAYVLDARQRLAPIGVPGELYIGGDGLARGYWNDAELTARRFVPDPLSPGSARRLYRTGDLVRWRQDGNLVFLGRMDGQVKIRGFRVEPGEIEAVLLEHPAVKEAVVVMRHGRDDSGELAACVLAPGAPPELATVLRSALRQRLPEYMIPAAIVCRDTLPLTASGKIDRMALPDLEMPSPQPPAAALESDLEHAIAAVWRETLAVEHAGADDNFFELGGHSLLLAKVHSRLNAILPQQVSMVDLFRYPTIRSLAAHLEAAGHEDAFLADIQARVEKQRARRRQRPVAQTMEGGAR